MSVVHPLRQQRCFHHPVREAVARCPDCHRHFCRECVAEHGERLLCAGCLAKRIAPERSRDFRAWKAAWRGLQIAAMVLLLWFIFFLVGRLLGSLPAATHDAATASTAPEHPGGAA
jgi:hypothetical protein